ncbi:sensor domain-containing diguanylate cyclase [Pelagerythrobacter aerophilus]
MARHALRGLLAIVAAALALLAASAAHAQPIAPACQATATLSSDPAGAGATAPHWRCDGSIADYRAPRALLRFDLPQTGEPPAYFTTRASTFGHIVVSVVDRGGAVRSVRYGMSDAELIGSGLNFVLSLPRITESSDHVVVAIDGAWVAPVVSDGRLVTSPDDVRWPLETMLALAAICGLLCMPLLFDLAFYRILKAPFLLWHLLSVLGMLALTLVSSGLVLHLADLTLWQVSLLLPLTSSIGVGAAAVFAADLFEKGCLPQRTRRLLRCFAGITAATSLVQATRLPMLREFGSDVFYFAFVPLIALFSLALGQAALRGSRAARYQFVACMPIWAIALERIFTNLGFGDVPHDQIFAFSAAVAFQLVVTSLGAADRFMILKHERDRAREQSLAMEAMAERDPLTGLLNRRAIEARFAELQRQGFDTMALIDLDHFKRVNDTHGHQVGDEVLRVCARVLRADGDRDAIALRLGGEEFMVLLRGPGTRQRAEHLRRAITQRVAADLEGLDAPVTASMGVIEVSAAGLEGTSFADLYARADKLLYEAKEAGRNRTMHERLTLFGGGERVRRAAVA